MNNPHREHENVSILLCQINFLIVAKSLLFLQIEPFIFSKNLGLNDLQKTGFDPPLVNLSANNHSYGIPGLLMRFRTVAR